MHVGKGNPGLYGGYCWALLAFVLDLLPSPAAAADGPLLWYRSGEGCPDASAFLRKLEKRSATARVAGMGDAIDFVVTLSRDATHGWGRVERQTSRGTVAIRELEAQSCEAVADGLALSLALAIEPEPPTSIVHASEPGLQESVGSSPPPSPARDVILEVPSGPDADAHEVTLAWRLGLQGGLFTLVGGALVGGGPFVEAAPLASEDRRGPVLRLAAWGTIPAAIAPDIDVWLLGGRLEACPWSFDTRRLELRPCIGLELGALSAERAAADSPRDTALWASLLGHVRVAWALTDAVAIEAQTGLGVALGRHDFIASTPPREAVARTDAIGLSAGVGMSMHLP
jgi:hypothetical protein